MKTNTLFRLFNLLALLSALVNCHSPSPSGQFIDVGNGIVGGSPVTSSDDFFEHIVAVYDEGTSALCTGTLIRQDLVLTAAHCVDGSPTANSFKIFLGLDLNSPVGRPTIKADTILIHGLYDKNRRGSAYDVALIKMAKSAPSKYKPATISVQADNFEDPANMYLAAGYGLTHANGSDSGTLRKLKVQGKNLTLSGLGAHSDQGGGSKGSLIAINASHDGGFCNGDSGGPLFKIIKNAAGGTSYAIIGVASQVTQAVLNGVKLNEFCKGIGYYTNVPTFALWIEKNAAKL